MGARSKNDSAVKNKTNRFMDNRIGRHLSGLTESVMNARYMAENFTVNIQKKPAKSFAPLDTSIPFTIKMPKTYEGFNRAPLQPKLDAVKLQFFLLQYIKDLLEDASEQESCWNFQVLPLLMPHLFDGGA